MCGIITAFAQAGKTGEQRMKWLDNVSLTLLLPVAVLLALLPFSPEPHLWEKLKMLAAGTLVRPIDIFDTAGAAGAQAGFHGAQPVMPPVVQVCATLRSVSGNR
jgi:hypothetical protein